MSNLNTELSIKTTSKKKWKNKIIKFNDNSIFRKTSRIIYFRKFTLIIYYLLFTI